MIPFSHGFTAALSVANLQAKISDQHFRNDITRLATTTPSGYRVDDAAELVIATLLSRVDD
jgi:hypothetical protein